MYLSVLNSLCYTTGWFWCVLFGIHGHSMLASLGAVTLIFVQLYCTKYKNHKLFFQDLFLVIFSVPLGTLLEIFFIQIPLIHYSNTSTAYPPVWIVLLYPLFALLINHSLKIIRRCDLVAFMLGFSGAPFSYLAGRSLGGLTFTMPLIYTWIIIGICWGLFLCLLIKTANVIEKTVENYFSDKESKV